MAIKQGDPLQQLVFQHELTCRQLLQPTKTYFGKTWQRAGLILDLLSRYLMGSALATIFKQGWFILLNPTPQPQTLHTMIYSIEKIQPTVGYLHPAYNTGIGLFRGPSDIYILYPITPTFLPTVC